MTIEDAEYEDDSDGIDPADLAGELDDEPPEDLAEDDDYGDEEDEIYSGTAQGGPLDGVTVDSRYPKGFLLIDMENRHVFIYDRQDDGTFKARDDSPAQLQEDGRWRAAEEEDYDILVPGMADPDDEGEE